MKNFAKYIKSSGIPFSKISQKTGIEEEKLSQLISQKAGPTIQDLRELSSFFGIPISDLLSESNSNDSYEYLFRKSYDKDVPCHITDKINARINNILKLDPNHSNVENIWKKLPSRTNKFEDAEILSSQFRLLYFNDDQLSPLNELPKLLAKKLGFIINIFELGKNIDGASASIKGMVFLFISPRFQGRMLFTLAHELAHIINHQDDKEDFFFIDGKIKPNKKRISEQEHFANTFASSLLLPDKGVASLLMKIRELNKIPHNNPIGDIEILYVSRFFGVSFDVAAFRLEALGLIPEGGSHSLSIKLNKDFGSPEKRADMLGLPPREDIDFDILPDYLIENALTSINKGKYSAGKVAQMLSIPVAELHSLNSRYNITND